MRAFLGLDGLGIGALALVTVASVGLEAVILDAVSRLMSISSASELAGTQSGESGLHVLMEAWSASLRGSKVFGRFLDPRNLYITTGQQALFVILLAMGLLSFVKLLEVRHRGKIVSRFSFRVRQHLITRFFNLRYAVFKQLSGRQVAHLASTEANQAVQGAGHLLALGSHGLSGLVYLVVAVFLNPFSTVVAIGLGAAVLALMKMLSKRLREISILHLDLMSRFNRQMVEASAVYKHARMTGARTEVSRELSNLAGRIAAAVKLRFDQASKVSAVQQPLLMFVLFGVLVLSLGSGMVSLSLTIIALGLIYRGVNCLIAGMGEYNNYMNSRSSMEGLRAFIEYLASSDDEALAAEEESPQLEAPDPVRKIQIFDVGYSVNRTGILHGVSFEASRGDVIGIFGHSGSGKSTLLEVMMGLVVPTSGLVRINDMMFSEFVQAGGRRRVGYVGSEMLVSDTAVLGQLFERLKTPGGVSDFRKALHDLGCSDWSGSLISKILDGAESERHGSVSMGQKQVLVLVNELMRNPEILILDEVSAHMDPALMRQVFSHLQSLSKERITFVVSHDIELLDYCSRAIVLKGGGIAGSGRPDELKELLSRPEAFVRAAEGRNPHLRHIVSERGGVKLQVSVGNSWIPCTLEEISIEGIGWIWAGKGPFGGGGGKGSAALVRLDVDGRKVILSGTMDESNDIGGRMAFTDLDAESLDFLESLIRALGAQTYYKDSA
jgi:ABC-type bacteriocin/lantibiotic exporter with double-glycine peptidase domain